MKMPPGPLPSAEPRAVDVDAVRSAMNGVRPRVAGALGDHLGLDDLDSFGLRGIGLGVEDVDARGAQARHDEVASLDMRDGACSGKGTTNRRSIRNGEARRRCPASRPSPRSWRRTMTQGRGRPRRFRRADVSVDRTWPRRPRFPAAPSRRAEGTDKNSDLAANASRHAPCRPQADGRCHGSCCLAWTIAETALFVPPVRNRFREASARRTAIAARHRRNWKRYRGRTRLEAS